MFLWRMLIYGYKYLKVTASLSTIWGPAQSVAANNDRIRALRPQEWAELNEIRRQSGAKPMRGTANEEPGAQECPAGGTKDA
jgi:hypothetical protein